MKNAHFELELEIVQAYFPRLRIVDAVSEKYLAGEIDIIDSLGRTWDTYSVAIKGSRDFPKRFPNLFETGNAFPKIMDWHVYEEDQSCCVDVTPNELLICENGITLLEYMKEQVVPYFANQTFRKREGYYLYGEYSHGIFGRIEYYQRKLKAKSPSELIKMFDLIIKGYHPERTSYCPFCHRIKFRKCHRDVFQELEKIKEFIYWDAKNKIIPFFNRFPGYKLPNLF